MMNAEIVNMKRKDIIIVKDTMLGLKYYTNRLFLFNSNYCSF